MHGRSWQRLLAALLLHTATDTHVVSPTVYDSISSPIVDREGERGAQVSFEKRTWREHIKKTHPRSPCASSPPGRRTCSRHRRPVSNHRNVRSFLTRKLWHYRTRDDPKWYVEGSPVATDGRKQGDQGRARVRSHLALADITRRVADGRAKLVRVLLQKLAEDELNVQMAQRGEAKVATTHRAGDRRGIGERAAPFSSVNGGCRFLNAQPLA